tara:strand:+ start:892 stop:1284 length:393 start_codon:yes stop_codon:yes gene_type:complete
MQMSMKEAKRRGMLQPNQMPANSNNFFETDIRLPEDYMANISREPIMFGGLGRMNGFGNDPEFNQNLENLQTSGLYGGFGSVVTDTNIIKGITIGGALLALTGNLNPSKMKMKDVAMYLGGGYILLKALN